MPLDAPVPLYQGERLRDLIFCYAGPWAFVPYLRGHEDEELLWNARQGVLLGSESNRGIRERYLTE